MLSQEKYNILRLYRTKNVGPKTFFKILSFFKDITSAVNNFNEFNLKFNTNFVLAEKSEIDKEIKNTEKYGAKIITYLDKEYSTMLKNISNYPVVLTILGDSSLLNKKSISIIGSRNCSSNGSNWTKKIANELGNNGLIITSGMATGIDASAHMGAINTGTIAVLGCGINNIYPHNNKDLYYKIKEKGLLVSEYPFDSPPKAENFHLRNRIISGISEIILVIECGAKSGTLITVKNALDQGREIFVAPGNPYDPRSEGSNKLIKDGANIFLKTEDILETLHYTIESKEENLMSKSKINNNKNENIDDLILSKINYTPIYIDILYEDFNEKLSISNFNSKITELELSNKITVENGYVKLKLNK